MWEWKLRFRLCQPNTSRSSQSAFNCLGEHSFVPTTNSILHSHVITSHKITDNLACLPRAFNWSTSSKLDWAIPVRKNASNQDMNILTENLYNDQRIWQITRFNLIWPSGITLCVDSNYITYRVGGMCCAPLWKVLISKYTWSRFSNINGDMALKKRVLLQNNRGFNFWKALCPHQNVSPFKPMNYNNLSRRVLNHRGPNYFDKQGSSNRFSCISFK